jgi:hypothetical protein
VGTGATVGSGNDLEARPRPGEDSALLEHLLRIRRNELEGLDDAVLRVGWQAVEGQDGEDWEMSCRKASLSGTLHVVSRLPPRFELGVDVAREFRFDVV